MHKPVFVLNGPNLNRLGLREPQIYGTVTLAEIERRCIARADALALVVDFRQTNHEGELVDWVHEAADAGSAIIVNAGAYTHTSVALHDALRLAGLAVVEVHLSNIHAREPFRHRSFVTGVALGMICGFGATGYELALEAVHQHFTKGS